MADTGLRATVQVGFRAEPAHAELSILTPESAALARSTLRDVLGLRRWAVRTQAKHSFGCLCQAWGLGILTGLLEGVLPDCSRKSWNILATEAPAANTHISTLRRDL